ncbi:hypothetical protein SAMN05428974_3749 [Sphingopyxis sp. YR583]|jgi:hypothetical protein|uniref:hypothetical protein n=1 Tax=Sphingopyxis sp. YR583 TaxID=1881047 RepID=UPI0008A73CAD|nr:hypothetical protein [Sphingopyxis sp. YR583]SEH19921.1 hypothetical protein SAMN05428974_3749 [Sphingopyxis sp. YR583]
MMSKGEYMRVRGLKLFGALLFIASLGACDWKSDTPLLSEADYVTPAIAGTYTMTIQGAPDPQRIVERPGRQFALVDSGNRELVFYLAALPELEPGIELFLAEASEKPHKYEYFIVGLERGRLDVYFPVCKNTALRPGIEETDSGACKFNSRAVLMQVTQEAIADMRSAKVRQSGFVVLRRDKD